MLADAVAQYLVAQKWQDVLVLRGPLDEDHGMVVAFERAADLFGLDIEDVRDFVLGSDPRAREVNDLAFLTGRASYDAVFVADLDGEFALGVPYATQDPATVVGASGLVPRIWHWSYLRHGAPQVHGRFERMHGRRMGEADWGAWIAMKIIGNGIARAKTTDPAAVADYLRAGKFKIDGSKGPGMSFRPWNNQLRQPIMLTTGDWVTARAPVEGFKHRTNDLDTLGHDERDSTCKF
jgi:ABC transporter substrate binding protein (PQQ-dependent alcohol dehydrogenase system)